MLRKLVIWGPLLGALGCAGPAALHVESTATVEATETLPSIAGTDHLGNEFSLASALETGPVVVIFYRGHW